MVGLGTRLDMSKIALYRMFVYGTLKRGQPNYPLLVNPKNGTAKLLGEAKLTKRYPLVVGSSYGVPMLLPAENQGQEVQGELFEVDHEMLQCLDKLENCPHTYIRKGTQCERLDPPNKGAIVDCEAYFLHNFKEELLSLPHLSSYDSRSPDQKPYVHGEDRDYDDSLYSEVKKS